MKQPIQAHIALNICSVELEFRFMHENVVILIQMYLRQATAEKRIASRLLPGTSRVLTVSWISKIGAVESYQELGCISKFSAFCVEYRFVKTTTFIERIWPKVV